MKLGGSVNIMEPCIDHLLGVELEWERKVLGLFVLKSGLLLSC